MESSNSQVVRIPPYHFIHVLNLNTHVTTLEIGPQIFVCQQSQSVVYGPEKMIMIPVMKYCVIENPVMRDDDGNLVVDKYGQVKLKVGDLDYRFAQEPFPLYPGEVLKSGILCLVVLMPNSALHLKALSDFISPNGQKHIAGEEWLFEGPGTFYPSKEVEIIKKVEALTIDNNSALVLKAKKDFVDRNGTRRIFGETWLVRTAGAYLPDVHEEFVEFRTAHVITEKVAIQLEALRSFTDDFNKPRKVGDNWLLTYKDSDCHICGVYEKFIRTVEATVLSCDQYCVILNPADEDGVIQWGKKKLVRGETFFFLHPGEELETYIENSRLLRNNECLVLEALERFVDSDSSNNGSSVTREAGERWIVLGPRQYFRPVQVSIVESHTVIPLGEGEGIYVRNIKTGHVRSVIGSAYLLTQDEELWNKEMPAEVLQLLQENKDPLADRGTRSAQNVQSRPIDTTRVISFNVPHNAAVQVYNYKNKVSRVEFGPALVLLEPDEQFTRLSLSGGKPKKPNVIKSLCLLLGPDFCTDMVVVETADHARLSIQLSYNWIFEIPNPCTQEEATKLFSVPDFIGDACKSIASRIRGAVASIQFDDFHKGSSRIIRAAVFGFEDGGKIKERYVFPQNNLVITNIDVQSVEPVDQRTRDALQKSVQLAIEITTNSQEATARHEAERLEQEARGRLERQKIEDEVAAEQSRRVLLETRVLLASLESTGQAKTEAESRAAAGRIEAEASIEQAKLRSEAMMIETNSELERLKMARAEELAYLQEKRELEMKFKRQEVEIEINRFTSMVTTLGPSTLSSMATADSEHHLRMLTALGLQSTLITDGTTPVNLLNTAYGLIGSTYKNGSKQVAIVGDKAME